MPQLSPLPWLFYMLISFTSLLFVFLGSEVILSEISCSSEENLKILIFNW